MNPVSLDEWIMDTPEGMPQFSQVLWFRDRFSPLFSENLYHPRVCMVIGIHGGRSIKLPVYQLTTLGGEMRMTTRANFRDYKFSIEAMAGTHRQQDPIHASFECLFDTNTRPTAAYFDGFPEDMVFGPYSENQRRFSGEVYSREDLYAVAWLALNSMGLIPRRSWEAR